MVIYHTRCYVSTKEKMMVLSTYADVVALLRARAARAPLLVGLDGHSAAGKSTLAQHLQQQLANLTIVRADDFYRVMDADERAALDAAGGYALYYDWQRLERDVLVPLSQGRAARYQRYDWANNCLGGWTAVEPRGIVVVEGVYTTRPELRGYYDLTLWVATDFAMRMRRQNERADPAEWVARWEAAEAYYVQQHAPQKHADAVISITDSPYARTSKM